MACSKFDKIEKLQKKLDKLSQDPSVANELINREMGQMDKITAINMAREEGELKGRAEGESIGEVRGKALGRAEGEAKEKASIAQKMLLAKMPLDQIIAITGLSKEEIEKINNEACE